ncbi:MAG TPA: ABC transporter ATP-binding protein [Acidimicrobiales bacterium]|nr:ABC transporter ATP-binding protein [Acidimicrobiales bacterium]
MSSLLEVTDLRTTFHTPRGLVRAVDGVSLSLAAGETLGIVGESGSGKSVLVRTLMGLIDAEPNASVSGQVGFDGVDLRALPPEERRRYWGTRIAMVFQDPTTSLNPVKSIRRHLVEHLRLHLSLGRKDAVARAAELLGEVGIPDPRRVLDRYPHELSGGQCQRVCIALALACRPQLLIADEPTTALDVTVQQQILELLDAVTSDTGMATLFITHDLALVNRHCERVVVMYGGRVAEASDVRTLHRRSRHPYTRALLRSAPRLESAPHTRLQAIAGRPPDLTSVGEACAFAPRCAHATDSCAAAPPLVDVGPAEAPHLVACHHPVLDADGVPA